MESPFFTVDEVASFLRKDKKWVYSHKEIIPGFFKIKGAIFFDREIMIKSLKELAFKPTPQKARRVSIEDQHGLL
ncbi:MAG: hypothetical protein WC799_18330 [Desulfobacteraceae bacterium]|jgi:hypothetical protein